LEDENHFPEAMNQSIYLMVSTPYITLAVVGFLIYRGCKKNAEYRRSLLSQSESPPPIMVQSSQGAT
jgi:hypothetical protein